MFNKSKTKSDGVNDVVPGSRASSSGSAEPKGAKSGVFQASQKPSVISEGLVMRGDLDSSNGVLHVEGGVVGNVNVDVANVGAGGFIEGNLTCNSLTIKGRFDGTLSCDELVIAASAQIKGRVGYRFITISTGAQVDAEMTWQDAREAA